MYEELDEAFLNAIEDFYTAEELISLLDISTRSVVELFYEEIQANEAFIREEMNYNDTTDE
jgi:hypothetical protein